MLGRLPRLSISAVRLSCLLLALGLAALALALAFARAHESFPGDEWVLLELRGLRANWLDDAAMTVSGMGHAGGGLVPAIPWVPVAVMAVTLGARRWTDTALLAVSILASPINLGLKELAARPRPDQGWALVEESGYGFPSGHAVVVAVFFGCLIILLERWPILDGRLVLRRTVQGVILLLILAVGVSRVYLGVHWPSDVIAGFWFGLLYLLTMFGVRNACSNSRQTGCASNGWARLPTALKRPVRLPALDRRPEH